MNQGKGTIAADFACYDGERQTQLEQTRKAVWLCGLSRLLPWSNQKRPSYYRDEGPYQSTGRLGVAYATTALHLAMYPPLQPFFREEMDVGARMELEARGDEGIRAIVAHEQKLRMREIAIQAVIESAGSDASNNTPALGFAGANYRHLMQLVATGSSMRYVDDDERVHVIRRNDFVTRRDTDGRIHETICRTFKDAMALTPEVQAAARIVKSELEGKKRDEREVEIYTHAEWQPQSKVWEIIQEINGWEINRVERKFSPYIPSEFELWPGDHEGRGLPDQLFADLSSYDQTRERFLDWIYAATQLTPVIDMGSEVLEEDLDPYNAGRTNGVPIRARVQGGQVQDIGYLQLNKVADFKVAFDLHEVLRGDLAKLMVIKADLAPKGEAGRSSEAWRQFSMYVNEATQGLYGQLVDNEHTPLIQYMRWRLEAKGILPAIPPGSARPRLLVGVAAMARQAQALGITDVLAVMAQFDPAAREKFDPTVLAEVLMRYRNIDTPGVIKTSTMLQQEANAKAQLAGQTAAATSAGDALGQVAVGALTNQ